MGLGCIGHPAHRKTAKVMRLSDDLPIVIERVDRSVTIARVVPRLDELICEGLVIVEPAEIRLYRGRSAVSVSPAGRARARRDWG